MPGARLIVSQKGDNSYRTVKEAVAHARPFDRIVLADPTIAEQVRLEVKNLTIEAEAGVTVVWRCPDKGAKKKGGPVGGPRQQFINFFHVDDANPLEYQVGIPQALRLMNSVQLNRTERPVAAAMKAGKGHVIEQMYLMAVSRPPTPKEQEQMEAYVTRHGDTSRTYGDILWALLNSSEFVTNH